jgi:rsbT co-antagonist protein RsbR
MKNMRAKDVQRFFERVATDWDTMRLAYYDERVFEKMAEISGVGKDSEVADVGTGTGFVAAGIAPRVKRVVGVDNAPAMLAVARKNLTALGVSNVNLKVGEATRLPLEDGSVDAAFANMVLHHAEHPTAMLLEMARVVLRLACKDFLHHLVDALISVQSHLLPFLSYTLCGRAGSGNRTFVLRTPRTTGTKELVESACATSSQQLERLRYNSHRRENYRSPKEGQPMIEKSKISDILQHHEEELLEAWVQEQLASNTQRPDLISDFELRQQSAEFLRAFRQASQGGDVIDITNPQWDEVREILTDLSRSRAQQGFTASETATFVFSLKQPLFARLRQELVENPDALAEEIWAATVLLDTLGLFTTEVYQQSREAVIARQQQELMELSTPVVKLWEGILAMPLIGTLDSARTQVIMESLLQQVVESEATIAIIDITGVPTVDTLVAQHLLKTVAAARLMGADCIISGIRPQIAQTIVQLGVDLNEVTTKASMAAAFRLALQRRGQTDNERLQDIVRR